MNLNGIGFFVLEMGSLYKFALELETSLSSLDWNMN